MLGEGYGEKQSWMAQDSAGGFSVRSFYTVSHRAQSDPYKLITYFTKPSCNKQNTPPVVTLHGTSFYNTKAEM